MEWIKIIPKWLFSATFLTLVGLILYLAFSGVELHYKNEIKFVKSTPVVSKVLNNSINSPKTKFVGAWGDEMMCDEGSYVCGARFQSEVEEMTKKPILNAIKLLCCSLEVKK